jgi:hypothetical protein
MVCPPTVPRTDRPEHAETPIKRAITGVAANNLKFITTKIISSNRNLINQAEALSCEMSELQSKGVAEEPLEQCCRCFESMAHRREHQ